MLSKHETLGLYSKCFQNMKHLGYIADADGILLWFPSQNRTFSVPKPYGFQTKNIRFWNGERKSKTS